MNLNIMISYSNIKEKAYVSLVIPTIEYASVVCDYYQQIYIYLLDMVQRRAAYWQMPLTGRRRRRNTGCSQMASNRCFVKKIKHGQFAYMLFHDFNVSFINT